MNSMKIDIEQLSYKAVKTAMTRMDKTTYRQAYNEAFASLIIRECVLVSEDVTNSTDMVNPALGYRISESIRGLYELV